MPSPDALQCPLNAPTGLTGRDGGHRNTAVVAHGSAGTTPIKGNRTVVTGPNRKWECIVCGFVYDEAEGMPDEGVPPGTAWEEVPEDWVCPDCSAPKSDFEMMEVTA